LLLGEPGRDFLAIDSERRRSGSRPAGRQRGTAVIGRGDAGIPAAGISAFAVAFPIGSWFRGAPRFANSPPPGWVVRE
jgi:hypothetical protein